MSTKEPDKLPVPPLIIAGFSIFIIVLVCPTIMLLDHFNILNILDFKFLFYGAILGLAISVWWLKIIEDENALKKSYNEGFKDGQNKK